MLETFGFSERHQACSYESSAPLSRLSALLRIVDELRHGSGLNMAGKQRTTPAPPPAPTTSPAPSRVCPAPTHRPRSPTIWSIGQRHQSMAAACMWRCAESDCMNAQVRNFRAKFRAKFRARRRSRQTIAPHPIDAKGRQRPQFMKLASKTQVL